MRHAFLHVLAALSFAAGADSLPPLPDGAFSYVCIPDTQAYGKVTDPDTGLVYVTNLPFASRVSWIVDNVAKERIVFVSHTGDVCDANGDEQWTFAEQMMSRLDGKVPYGVSPGNHDQETDSQRPGDTSLYAARFPSSRFGGYPWYAGCYEGYVNLAGYPVSGNNANSCQLIEAEGHRFVIVHIENNAPASVLRWADEQLEKYADRHAIIATHMFIGHVLSEYRSSASKTQQPPPEQLGLLEWTKRHAKEGESGRKMWERHFCRHPNVFLIVCGDQSAVMTHHMTLTGDAGNRVDAFMQDYSMVSGADWLRIFRFQPNDGKIEVYTYSPRKDCLCEGEMFWNDPKWHRFTIPFPVAVGGSTSGDGSPEPLPPGALPVVPVVTNVVLTQKRSHQAIIRYDLLHASAVVTADVETNTLADASGAWVSVGGANVSGLEGDVNRVVASGQDRIIRWTSPFSVANAAGVRVRLTAWALDDTPDCLVVDLSAGLTRKDRVRYFADESFLPGGLMPNHDYRTSRIVMKRIRAKNRPWTMGTTAELGRGTNEKSHPVVLDHDYYIGIFEVTQGQWRKIGGNDPTPSFADPLRAMNNVTYPEIRENTIGKPNLRDEFRYPNGPCDTSFVGVLREMTGLDFELPGEAEWEYACRAGNGEGLWGTGTEILDEALDANLPGRYKENVGGDQSVAVAGSYAPNAWGLYDMHGNVRELCLDWYVSDVSALGGAVNTTTASRVVIRGGDYHEPAKHTRSAHRDDAAPTGRAGYTGFRLVCRAGLK